MSTPLDGASAGCFISEPSPLVPSSSSARTLGTSRRIRQLLELSVDKDSIKDLARYISSASAPFSFSGFSSSVASEHPSASSASAPGEDCASKDGKETTEGKVKSYPSSNEVPSKRMFSTDNLVGKGGPLPLQIPTAAALRSSLEDRMMNTHRTFFAELTSLYDTFQTASHLVHNVAQQVDEMESLLRPHSEDINEFVLQMKATKAALQREEEREAQVNAIYEQLDFKPADQELLLHGAVGIFFLEALERARVVYKSSKAMLVEVQRHGTASSSSSAGTGDGRNDDLADEAVDTSALFSLRNEKGSPNATAFRVYDVGVGVHTAMTTAIQHLKLFLLTPVKQPAVKMSPSLFGEGTTNMNDASSNDGVCNDSRAIASSGAASTSRFSPSASMSADYPELSAFYLRCIRVLYDFDPVTWENVVQVVADMRRSSVLRRYCHLLATGSATTSAGTYQYAGSHSIPLANAARSTSSLCLRPLEADLDRPLYFFRAVLAWLRQTIAAEIDLLSHFFFDTPSQCVLTSVHEMSSTERNKNRGAIEGMASSVLFTSANPTTSLSLLELIVKIFDHTASHIENAMNTVLDRFLPSSCTLPSPPAPLVRQKGAKKLAQELFSSPSLMNPTAVEEEREKSLPSNEVGGSLSTSTVPTGGGKLALGRRIVSSGFRKIFKLNPSQGKGVGQNSGRLELANVMVTPAMLVKELHLPKKNVLEVYVSSSRSQQMQLSESFLHNPLSGMKELFRLGLLFEYYSQTVVGPLVGKTSKLWVLLNEKGSQSVQEALEKILLHLSGHLWRSTLMLVVSNSRLQQLEESVMLESAIEAKTALLGIGDSVSASDGDTRAGSEWKWYHTAMDLLRQVEQPDFSFLLLCCFPSSYSFFVLHFLFMYQRQDVDVYGAVFNSPLTSSDQKDTYLFLDRVSESNTQQKRHPSPSSSATASGTTTSSPGNPLVEASSTVGIGLTVGKKNDPMLHAAARDLEKSLSQLLLTPPAELIIMIEGLQTLKQEYEKQQSILREEEIVQTHEAATEDFPLISSSSSSSVMHFFLLTLVRHLLMESCSWNAVECSPLLSQRLDTPCQYILLLNVAHAVARGFAGTLPHQLADEPDSHSTETSTENRGHLASSMTTIEDRTAKAYQLVIARPTDGKHAVERRNDQPPLASGTPPSRFSFTFSPSPSPPAAPEEALKVKEDTQGEEALESTPHPQESTSAQSLEENRKERERGRDANGGVTIGMLARTYQFIVTASLCAGALHYYFPISLPSSFSSSIGTVPPSSRSCENTDVKGNDADNSLFFRAQEADTFFSSPLEANVRVARQLLYFFRLVDRLREKWSLPLLSCVEEVSVREAIDLSVRRALLAHYTTMYQGISLVYSELSKTQKIPTPRTAVNEIQNASASEDTIVEVQNEQINELQQLICCTPELLKSYLCPSSNISL